MRIFRVESELVKIVISKDNDKVAKRDGAFIFGGDGREDGVRRRTELGGYFRRIQGFIN